MEWHLDTATRQGKHLRCCLDAGPHKITAELSMNRSGNVITITRSGASDNNNLTYVGLITRSSGPERASWAPPWRRSETPAMTGSCPPPAFFAWAPSHHRHKRPSACRAIGADLFLIWNRMDPLLIFCKDPARLSFFSERIDAMNDITSDPDQNEEDILTFEVSDELTFEVSDDALESAVGPSMTLGACTGLFCPGCAGSPVPSPRRKRRR
jgi:hypothetical protein